MDLTQLAPEKLWYLIGLITADGCLYNDGRHLNITAKEKLFLLHLKNTIGLTNKISKKFNGQGDLSHHIQFGNKKFYQFLLSIGLKPRKSLTLGKLFVDKKYFHHFLRGVIDGDGAIRSWIHPTNGGVQWSLRIFSASDIFIRWLKNEIENYFNVKGRLHKATRAKQIKFGKMAGVKVKQLTYL